MTNIAPTLHARTDAANGTSRTARAATGPRRPVVASSRRPSRDGGLLQALVVPVDALKGDVDDVDGRLLRAAGSAQHSAEHAEAAGACSSEPCSCCHHGELRHDLARVSIPGDSLARPSVRPWGTFSCRSTTPRAHATNSCMGPVAAAGLPPAPSRSRVQPVGYPDPFFLFFR